MQAFKVFQFSLIILLTGSSDIVIFVTEEDFLIFLRNWIVVWKR